MCLRNPDHSALLGCATSPDLEQILTHVGDGLCEKGHGTM